MFPPISHNQANHGGGGNRTRERSTQDSLRYPNPESERRSAGLHLALGLVRRARLIGGSKTWTYFIQQESDGPIKVGVGRNPFARLRELQVGNSATLQLRAVFYEFAALERVIHSHFADSRIRGEWFECHPDLLLLAETFHDFTTTDPRSRSRLMREPWFARAEEYAGREDWKLARQRGELGG